MRRTRDRPNTVSTSDDLTAAISRFSSPLQDEVELDPLLKKASECRIVLLGEASHGTSEFYTWRSRLTRRLVAEQGFSFIAVEGDWPDCHRINRFVKAQPDSGASARQALMQFHRWPTWMWANEEMVELVVWLRAYNEERPLDRRVGFYGLDVYSLWESLDLVLAHLRSVDGPEAAASAARRAFNCFEPYDEDPQRYAQAMRWIPDSCEEEVIKLLSEVRSTTARFDADGPESVLDAEQNATVIRNAEHYYRTMGRGDGESWNVRDRHMVDTLIRLLDFHGPDSKAIVWAHNTHIGDARATDMAASGMVNVGQLVREQFSAEECLLVGFGTNAGTVIAGDEWGAPWKVLTVPPARHDSWDGMLADSGRHDQILLFDASARRMPLLDAHGQRAIGVVYHPRYERLGNYVPTILPMRYDALLYFHTTRALRPLPVTAGDEEVPETYPTGV